MHMSDAHELRMCVLASLPLF